MPTNAELAKRIEDLETKFDSRLTKLVDRIVGDVTTKLPETGFDLDALNSEVKGLLRESLTNALEVNRQVIVLMTREAVVRHLNEQILDVTEDEAVNQEFDDAADCEMKIECAIADG
ncbi:hypothetical protein HPB51_009561 [Rhipicephalus microplus]|uniref:Uncharacterized protein n=1 Tax=Rhipicephalus microplus TaxID=6941 RepID=A0A9J6DZU5_RHIMP|nr:hypothetical protein HPB51_009561 [Rhipicephalus microplus]